MGEEPCSFSISCRWATMRKTFFDHILDSFAVIAGCLFLFSTVSTCFEVVMRYFFLKPTNWILEINEFILYIAPFVASAWILKHDDHVKMDLLIGSLPQAHRAILNGITSILGAIICLILAWFGGRVTLDSFQTGYLTATGYIRIVRGYIMLFGVLGFVLIAVQFVRRAISYFKDEPQKRGL